MLTWNVVSRNANSKLGVLLDALPRHDSGGTVSTPLTPSLRNIDGTGRGRNRRRWGPGEEGRSDTGQGRPGRSDDKGRRVRQTSKETDLYGGGLGLKHRFHRGVGRGVVTQEEGRKSRDPGRATVRKAPKTVHGQRWCPYCTPYSPS